MHKTLTRFVMKATIGDCTWTSVAAAAGFNTAPCGCTSCTSKRPSTGTDCKLSQNDCSPEDPAGQLRLSRSTCTQTTEHPSFHQPTLLQLLEPPAWSCPRKHSGTAGTPGLLQKLLQAVGCPALRCQGQQPRPARWKADLITHPSSVIRQLQPDCHALGCCRLVELHTNGK